MGYNVQTAVDAEHHLIVEHEVINDGLDRDQLAPMAEKAKEAIGADELTVVADRGYFKSEQILECTRAGITPLVPKTMTSNSLADGRFDERDFILVRDDNEYRCPAGERAIYRYTSMEDGLPTDTYWSSACPRCAMRALCTTADYRRIKRWKHAAVLEAMQERLDRRPDKHASATADRGAPMGTLKMWMGATHFLSTDACTRAH